MFWNERIPKWWVSVAKDPSNMGRRFSTSLCLKGNCRLLPNVYIKCILFERAYICTANLACTQTCNGSSRMQR